MELEKILDRINKQHGAALARMASKPPLRMEALREILNECHEDLKRAIDQHNINDGNNSTLAGASRAFQNLDALLNGEAKPLLQD